MIICECDDEIEILDSEQTEIIGCYYMLLIKFNDAMKNDFLTEERKRDGILDLFKMDKWTFGELVDFFYFSTKGIGN